jgi:hypothetical protein
MRLLYSVLPDASSQLLVPKTEMLVYSARSRFEVGIEYGSICGQCFCRAETTGN